MPNQRSPNKIYLGGFVQKQLHARILRLAKKAGMEHNKFGFVTELLQECVQLRTVRKRRKPSPRKPSPPKR